VKVAFDSSVIIAGAHDLHPHHGRAVVWIDAVTEQRLTGVVTWHALVEIWSVLTCRPRRASAQNKPCVSSVGCSGYSNSTR
jgi:predicted nucleic acid-binding protein